jgi:hypothetical protein
MKRLADDCSPPLERKRAAPNPDTDDWPLFRDWIWRRHAPLLLLPREQLCRDAVHVISRLLLQLMLDNRFHAITAPPRAVVSRRFTREATLQFELSRGLAGLRRFACTGRKEPLTMYCFTTLGDEITMDSLTDHAQLIRCLELGDRGAALELSYVEW